MEQKDLNVCRACECCGYTFSRVTPQQTVVSHQADVLGHPVTAKLAPSRLIGFVDSIEGVG